MYTQFRQNAWRQNGTVFQYSTGNRLDIGSDLVEEGIGERGYEFAIETSCWWDEFTPSTPSTQRQAGNFEYSIEECTKVGDASI
eukprot:COSAG02_NODE_40962_length_399_cov_1.280000_1_plen_83_part_10